MIEAEKTYEHILFEQDDAVAYVTMNRPKKRNALSLEHMRELISLFEEIGEDRSASVVILRGEGRAFCAGHDLSEMIGRIPILPSPLRRLLRVDGDHSENTAARHSGGSRRRHRGRLPARSHLRSRGCFRGSTVRYAWRQDRAVLLHPDGRLEPGRRPEKSMEMLLTGEFISAEALAEGLVNRVVSAEDLDTETRSLAEKIADASPLVVGIGKQAFYRQLGLPTEQAYAYTKEVMSFNASFADAQEGIGAFLEKRKPEWKGR